MTLLAAHGGLFLASGLIDLIGAQRGLHIGLRFISTLLAAHEGFFVASGLFDLIGGPLRASWPIEGFFIMASGFYLPYWLPIEGFFWPQVY